jgi:hypothetical protein
MDNIKIDLREIGWGRLEWIDMAQDMEQWKGSFEHGNEVSGSQLYSWKCAEGVPCTGRDPEYDVCAWSLTDGSALSAHT